MKLSAIKSLCAGGKHATIYNTLHYGGQWIGNGFGAWLVEDFHIEDEAALMSMWNMSQKARANAVIVMKPCPDRRFTYRPFPGEEELKELGGVAWSDETTYIALESSRGLLWIDAAMLKPVRGDYRQYSVRWDNGRPLVAVWEDLTRCVALILPASDFIAAQLSDMAVKMTAKVFRWPDPDAEAAEAERAAEEAVSEGD